MLGLHDYNNMYRGQWRPIVDANIRKAVAASCRLQYKEGSGGRLCTPQYKVGSGGRLSTPI